MPNAEITGWGKCLPPTVLTNDEIASVIDTDDEWIVSRTGIKERRVSHVQLSQLCIEAGKQALACAGLEAEELDLIIVATASGDKSVPNTASMVQQRLGAWNAAAFDLNAACTGFVYSMLNAQALIKSGQHKKVLVIGADRLVWFIDWSNRNIAVLFGDGAGAVIVEASEKDAGVVSGKIGCDAKHRDILQIHGFGSELNRINTTGVFDVHFEGPEIFKRAVKGMCGAVTDVLEAAGLEPSGIDLAVPHQANIRIIEALAKKLKMPMDKVMVNVNRYGNTSAGSVPIALCEAMEQGRIKPGDNILSAAFGAGLTWGALILKWGERVEPKKVYEPTLPACNQTALEMLDETIKACLTRERVTSEDQSVLP